MAHDNSAAPSSSAPNVSSGGTRPPVASSPVAARRQRHARFEGRLHELLRRASAMLLGEDGTPAPLARLATSSPLDDLLGGGLPRGRVVELYGPPSGGKTALALSLAAGVQARGGAVAFVDMEGSLDASRAQAAGLDVLHLIAARPRVGEEALQIVDGLLRARAADFIVVDSVAALVPRAELTAPLGEAPAGLHARLMSQAMRRMVSQVASASAVVMFLNQQRTAFHADGTTDLTTTGGQALHFYAATRLEVRRRDATLVVRVVKDRFGAEGRFAFVDLAHVFRPS